MINDELWMIIQIQRKRRRLIAGIEENIIRCPWHIKCLSWNEAEKFNWYYQNMNIFSDWRKALTIELTYEEKYIKSMS